MKKKIFIAVTILAASSATSIISAQNPITSAETDGQKVKTKSNIKNDRIKDTSNTSVIIKITNTQTGFDIIFKAGDKPITHVSGDPHVENMPGKIQSSSFIFSIDSSDNSVTEIKNQKEVSSGMPAGKTSFSDLSVMINLEKASVGKSKPKKIEAENGEFTLADLPDGDHTITCEWNWGATDAASGATVNTGLYSVTFTLKISEGQLHSIDHKGTDATNPPKSPK
jgi:predicted RND superfamily exporter protein